MGENEFENKIKELSGVIDRRDIKLSEEEIDERWKLDSERALLRRKHRILWNSVSIAVAACAVIAFLTWHTDFVPSEIDTIEHYALSQRPAADNTATDIRLIMADKTEMSVGGEESYIDYTLKGKIVVDSDTIDEISDDSAPRFNQLIVPHGRRTRLRLSDGTRMYVNSGTRVVYPLTFVGILRVLGTKFNVFAYQDENPNVVLVEGSVDVATSQTQRRLKPGQKVEISGDGLGEPEKVDVESYISWTNNELIYDDEPLASVFRRLQTYYGFTFDIRCDISRVRISGRLSLAENPADVLSAISFAVPVEISSDNTVITVTAK